MPRPASPALLFVFGVLVVAPAAAQTTLEAKPAVGARKEVVETTSSVLERQWKAKHAKVGDAEAVDLERRYTEEVKSAQPEVLLREYGVSTRAKHHPQEAPDPVRTSLHGRRVRVVGLGLQPEETFEISKEDREALRLDRLPAALLPPQRVAKKRDAWDVSGEAVVGALFGPAVQPTPECGAKVTFRALKKSDGREVASLRAKVRLSIARRDNFPGVEATLQGDFEWAVAEGTLLAASFEGPLEYVLGVGEDGELSASGTLRFSYAAQLLEAGVAPGAADRRRGDPPPPGTRALICKLDPSHRYELAPLTRCMSCGKPLDKDRRCPEGDGWPLWFCPRDGAPLEPGE